MKKIIAIALMVILIATILVGSVMAGPYERYAPNSGDGVSDGSGWHCQVTVVPVTGEIIPCEGDNVLPDHPALNNDAGVGPAPNSGDGIPDGSGF